MAEIKKDANREAGNMQTTRQVRLRLHAAGQEVGRSGREAGFSASRR